jgi:hypothetical protein
MLIEYVVVRNICKTCREQKRPPETACDEFTVVDTSEGSRWNEHIPLYFSRADLGIPPSYSYRIEAHNTIPELLPLSAILSVREWSIEIIAENVCWRWEEKIRNRLYDRGVRFLLITSLPSE